MCKEIEDNGKTNIAKGRVVLCKDQTNLLVFVELRAVIHHLQVDAES